MSVKLMDNTPRVSLEIDQRLSLFLRLMIDVIHLAALPITPKDKGNLRDDVLKRVSGKTGKMEWRKVYAGVQERGFIKGSPVVNYTTPGTGAHYAERAVAIGIGKTTSVARKVRLI